MEIVVVALGSAGDVHPFIGIAIHLQRRGHTVSVLANAHFKQSVQDAGLRFHPVGLVEEYARTVNDPMLWNPTKGVETLWRYFFEPATRRTYKFIQSRVATSACLVLASPMAFGARLAHEKLGVPLISCYLAPANLRTCHGSLRIAGATIPAWVPRWVRKILWRYIDHKILDPVICPALNEYRQELGLSPVKRVFEAWYHKSSFSISLFPEWFSETQPDWPKHHVVGDFPLFDCASSNVLSSDLESFLINGEKPLVFMPGSAMQHAKVFFQTSLDACVELGCRAIFLTQNHAQIPQNLPQTVKHFLYAPFSLILPRAAGLIHHGGIGSCAQALRAGVPQLIMPMAYDQFDNAGRVTKFGVGLAVKRSHYKNPVVKRRLETLLNSEVIRMKCRKLALNFNDVNPADKLCCIIEEMALKPV